MKEKITTGITVTDIDTYEVLFVNQVLKEALGEEHPEGKPCWQILQKGMDGPCPFCPLAKLTGEPHEGDAYVWEEHNTRNGRIYQNYGSFLPWKDGRLVHFQHSVDVTGVKKLLKEARMDELTGILNRRAGKEALAAWLKSDRTFTVCMLDVNDLKGVNDEQGHQAGDELLVRVADAIRAVMQPEDQFFRLSGDEFVLILPGLDREEMAARMKRAQDSLRLPNDREDRFCFGFSCRRENCRQTVESLLAEADADLYVYKRRLHVRRMADRLRRQGIVPSPEFDYDPAYLYDALVNSTEDYLFLCNVNTGTCCFPIRMVREFDLPGQVVENATAVWGERVHPEDRDGYWEEAQRLADGKTDSHDVEYRAKDREGRWQRLRCRARMIRDGSGKPVLFAGFIARIK